MSTIPRDVQDFLDGYPHNAREDDQYQSDNLEFYANRQRSRPDRMLIEQIHDQWLGRYDILESKHGFIQWLFPIQEHGMNYESLPLTRNELGQMKADPVIVERILTSYRLMLDFYGMQLLSTETGLIDRVAPPRNYAARYSNLVRSTHNNLRISRILKCLSEFGLERLNAGFLLHVLSEQSEANELNGSALRSSMDRWWANCLRNEEERTWIRALIQKARAGDDGFIFTRQMSKDALERRRETGHF